VIMTVVMCASRKGRPSENLISCVLEYSTLSTKLDHEPCCDKIAQNTSQKIAFYRHSCTLQQLVDEVFGQHSVLCEYIAYYNHARPHQGLDQQAPIPWMIHKAARQVQCRNLLGDILHDYYQDAA
jgi:hypothetical protein